MCIKDNTQCNTTHLQLRQRIVIWFVNTLFSKNGFSQQNIGTLIRVIEYYAHTPTYQLSCFACITSGKQIRI